MNDVDAFIKGCGKCHCQNIIKEIESKPIIIKTYGPIYDISRIYGICLKI